jgi:hypothetical protein
MRISLLTYHEDTITKCSVYSALSPKGAGSRRPSRSRSRRMPGELVSIWLRARGLCPSASSLSAVFAKSTVSPEGLVAGFRKIAVDAETPAGIRHQLRRLVDDA